MVKKSILFILRIISIIYLYFLKIFFTGLVFENKGILFFKLKLKGSVKVVLKSGHIINSKLVVNGINNILLFDNDVKIDNCKFIITGDNCLIDFRGNRLMQNSKFELLDSNTHIIVKNSTGFNGNRILVAGLGNKIEIGKECIFAENVELWASDTHSILDIETNERLNPDQPIIIEDYVWICNRALVMKGVRIGKHSVIASGSIVTKDIRSNVIAAGIPAKIIKDNIKWDINRLCL
jgi:acetyltransferase-like isoleucine patch superfamily enzyme